MMRTIVGDTAFDRARQSLESTTANYSYREVEIKLGTFEELTQESIVSSVKLQLNQLKQEMKKEQALFGENM